MQKIETADANRARECVQWLIKNIGPETSVQGSTIRSEGWHLWTSTISNEDSNYNPIYFVEVNDHVDKDTQLLFALRWA